jgi:hypothetical protein
MTTHKVIILRFIMIFTFIFFMESVSRDVCFCASCCPNVFQDKLEIKTDFTCHKSSLCNTCKNCRLKNGNFLKAVHYSEQIFMLKIFNISIISNRYAPQSSGISSLDFASRVALPFKSLPFYLLDLSFRC